MSVVIVTAGVEQLMQVAVVTDPGSAAPGRRTCGDVGATQHLHSRGKSVESSAVVNRQRETGRAVHHGRTARRSNMEYLETMI